MSARWFFTPVKIISVATEAMIKDMNRPSSLIGVTPMYLTTFIPMSSVNATNAEAAAATVHV